MLTRLKSLWRSRSKTTRPRGRRLRPTMEVLEDRCTPSAGVHEQYLLELMNRMREHPISELDLLLADQGVQQALTYFKVDQQLLRQQFDALQSAPPLAWNDALASSSLGQSQLLVQDDYLAQGIYQGTVDPHNLPGEANLATRVYNAGFNGWGTVGENIDAFASSMFDCHAGWAIDWGPTATGIQNPPGHRNHIMDSNFQAVGIGVVKGTGTGDGAHIGPWACTADFGTPVDSKPYLVGVVYKDPHDYANYSEGSGLAGVTLTITGTGGTFTTTTSAAGGYQIQLPPGSYGVTASGGDFGPAQTVGGVVITSHNWHLNFHSISSTSLKAAPTLTGPATAKPGGSATVSWTAVPGASGYHIYLDYESPSGSQGYGGPVTDVSGTSFTFSALDTGTYWIKVCALDAAGYEAPWSNTIVINAVAKARESLPPHLHSVAYFFSHSPEQYANLVTAAYQKYLHRAPDALGLAGWVRGMQAGLTDEQLEAFFIGSAEYIASRGAGPGHWAPWVTSMYQDLLGRTPSQAEVQLWVSGLNLGISSAYVAHGFAASAERETQRVTADYVKYLGRVPAAAEVAQWVSAFVQGWATNEYVVAGFVGSAEYFARHGGTDWGWLRTAYQDILGRRPDDAGFAAWMQYLDSN